LGALGARNLTRTADTKERWCGLMKAAQDGDRAAYDRLLREVTPFVRALAMRLLRAPDRAEDAAQDVLLTVHRARHAYDPKRSFKPWLATITHRRCIDLLRRRGRTAAYETSNDAAYETFADPGANKTMEVYATTEGLGEAIASLAPQQREAVELLKLREMSLAEASETSGRSVGALKVNVHRAIKSLRARWIGDGR
jgi:RNA polymerase sigma-70 factor (ECF subfamily)